jgi:hypothetical protein
MKVVFYIAIVLILEILKSSTKDGPGTILHMKGYGMNNDDIGVLLDRIEWSNNYNGRNNIYGRILFMSIISILMLNVVIQKDTFKPLVFLQCVVICFIVLVALNFFTQYHYDKFSNYAISKNIKLLRKKLNLKKGKKLLEHKINFQGNSEAWNYTYSS